MRLALIVAASLALAPQQPPERSIDIWSVDPIALDIEWITIDADGQPIVTARRQTVAGPPAPLTFIHAPDRYVRFSYAGASPRTYSTSELIAAKKLHVPDVLPGGELLLLSPDMPVRPIAFEVRGPRVTRVANTAMTASLAGLPPGEYTVTRVYEGGLKGQSRSATVSVARSTILLMAPEDVGAVRILGAGEVCAAATEAGINSLVRSKSPNVVPTRTRVFTANPPRCDVTVAGLRPGDYEAFYRRDGSAAGRREFDLEAQEIARADITGPVVRVDGRVTFNGKPVPNAVIDFHAFPSPGRLSPMQSQATTDLAGFYAVALETPGSYRVALGRSRMMGLSEQRIELIEGVNRHDIAMTGGSIRIKLVGWDGRTPVHVTTRATAGGNASVNIFSEGSKSSEALLEGFPLGEHTVSVIVGGRPVPRETPGAQRALLTTSTPEVTLTFDVSKK